MPTVSETSSPDTDRAKAAWLTTYEALDELQGVFEKDYHFEVKRRKIRATDRPRPDNQLRKALGDFICEFDDGSSVLYIIYYAGHGWAGEEEGHLNLAGSTSQAAQEEQHLNKVVWNTAEGCIRNVEADILLVFDCCDAGALKAGRGHHTFEFLGACQEREIAPLPGINSFTSAMICALRKLAKHSRGFYTTELQDKIIKHEDFPRDRHPVLVHRFQSQGPHIWIEPMKASQGSVIESKGQVDLARTSDSAVDWIDLRLSFDRVQSQKEVEVLAKVLKEHDRSLGLSEVNVLQRSPDYHLRTKFGTLWFQKWRQRHPLPFLPQRLLEDPAPQTPLTAPSIVTETSSDSGSKRASQADQGLQYPSPPSGSEEAPLNLICPLSGKQKWKNSEEPHVISSPPKRRRTTVT
ncbi:MAG: hypothetical protein Q9160_007242 [Pyrenula sp. 1 TL-2023]